MLYPTELRACPADLIPGTQVFATSQAMTRRLADACGGARRRAVGLLSHCIEGQEEAVAKSLQAGQPAFDGTGPLQGSHHFVVAGRIQGDGWSACATAARWSAYGTSSYRLIWLNNWS